VVTRTVDFQLSTDEVFGFFPPTYDGGEELKKELEAAYAKRCWERWELERLRKQFKDAGGQSLGATMAWEEGEMILERSRLPKP
jgi:hypothetical protein